MSFFERLKLALAFLFGSAASLPAAQQPALPAVKAPEPIEPKAATPAPALTAEQTHASALFLLSLMQREGRLIDFLNEDISAFSDADIGAAARLVHSGCSKALTQYLPVKAIVNEGEGATVTVPTGFDANRFRLAGNVTGTGPWKGSLKHHGWEVSNVALPALPVGIDAKVIAAAEVELP